MKKEEDTLQNQCNRYLDALQAQGKLRYIHLPKQIQRHIWSKRSHVPAHVAALTSRALKGTPDLLIWKPLENIFTKGIIIELKSEKGKLTPEQKEWIPFGLQIVRDLKSFYKIIEEFLK